MVLFNEKSKASITMPLKIPLKNELKNFKNSNRYSKVYYEHVIPGDPETVFIFFFG